MSNALTSTVTYTAIHAEASQAIEAQKEETKLEQIDRIALAHNIATTTLYNLAFSESSLGEKRVGDSGKSCGIIHFHKDYYPEENSRCGDDEYILSRAAEMIANDEEWKFTPCNCVSYTKTLVGKLPRMWDIVPNSLYPRIGDLVILRYTNDKHIAVITKVTEAGVWIKEANFKPCALGTRLIEFGDSHLKGYYSLAEG